MEALASDPVFVAMSWVIVAIGLGSLALAVWKGRTVGYGTGIPNSTAVLIGLTLLFGLVPAALIGSLPLTIGSVALNLAWLVAVAGSRRARRSGVGTTGPGTP